MTKSPEDLEREVAKIVENANLMGSYRPAARAVIALVQGHGEVPSASPKPPADDGWLDIAGAPRNTPVDLWRSGERLTDFQMDNAGHWCRAEGYPATTRVLTSPPTHYRPRPPTPAG